MTSFGDHVLLTSGFGSTFYSDVMLFIAILPLWVGF